MTSRNRRAIAGVLSLRTVGVGLFLGMPSLLASQTPRPATCGDAAPIDAGSELIPTRSFGVDVGVIDADSAGRGTKSLSELLTTRTTGVSVLRSSGLTGAGSRVTMRGSSGIYAPLYPLLFVDGMRVEDQAHSIGIDIGGQAPSRLDDFSSDEIACVYVLRGPAATAMYGTDASAGIIHVITRHADSTAAFRWRAFSELGFSNDAGDYPANFSSTPAPGSEADFCTRAEAASGLCPATPMRAFRPLRSLFDPFHTAPHGLLGGEVSGRTSGTRLAYSIVGSGNATSGVLEPNDASAGRLRVNLAYQFAPTLAVDGGISLMMRQTTLPYTDDNINSVLYLTLSGGTGDDSVYRDYYAAIRRVSVVETTQRAQRYGGHVGVRWQPSRWLAVRIGAGEEWTGHDDEQDLARFAGDARPAGYTNRHLAEFDSRHVTLDAAATGSFQLSPRLRMMTTLGAQRTTVHQVQQQFDTVGFLEQGAYSISYQRSRHDAATVGLVATEQLAWADARYITLGARADHLRRQYDLDNRNEVYPFASGAWHVGRESFFRRSRVLNDVTVRAAYGQTGESRGYDVPEDLIDFWGFIGGVRPPVPKRRVARTSEIEIGSDLTMFADRLALGVSVYRKKTTDGVTLVLAPSPFGTAMTILGNGASWWTKGIEVASTVRAIARPSLDASISLGFSALRSRIDSIAGPQILTPVGRNLVKGAPVSSVWSRRYTASDSNGDGVLASDEITFPGDAILRGYGEPSRELWLAPTMRVGAWRAAGVVDYRGGFAHRNQTEAFRCRFRVCRALYDPAASLEEQAAAVEGTRTSTGIVDDADFVRLRELSVSWTLPQSLRKAFGTGSAAVTIAARNLATWTSYSGLDPEVTSAGQRAYGTVESFTLPIPRTFVLRFDVGR